MALHRKMSCFFSQRSWLMTMKLTSTLLWSKAIGWQTNRHTDTTNMHRTTLSKTSQILPKTSHMKLRGRICELHPHAKF